MLVRSTGTSKEGKDLLSTTSAAKETRPVYLIALTPNGIVCKLSSNTGCPKLCAPEIQPVRAGWDLVFLTACCRRQNCGPGEAAGVACFQGKKVATRTDIEIAFEKYSLYKSLKMIWNLLVLWWKDLQLQILLLWQHDQLGVRNRSKYWLQLRELFRFQVSGRSIQPVLQGGGDSHIGIEASPYTTSQRGVQTNRSGPVKVPELQNPLQSARYG